MDKLQSLDWRGLYKSAKNSVKKYSLNLTDLEVKVEDATSNETWGPHGSVMTGAIGCRQLVAARTAAEGGAAGGRVQAHNCTRLPAFAEIAEAAFDPENYRQIMGVIARRLQERVRAQRRRALPYSLWQRAAL